ncbi:OB-fold domain-containing protein [Nocardioides sp.]|uniref:Zn-ribbon domain-containing OB-fold protein n=1 Tax=Nocardioides sp. TaxID=35761 RepID=UPI001A317F7E|nr:OB-fold domain-containing protein [Nocardioides sp.]MBJ7358710.1 OB-fold domain-containing protein [Nocardioides sp.]
MERRRDDWTADVPVLMVTACGRCGNHWYLPHEHCPVCGSDEVADVAASGGGLCVAVTRLHVTAEPTDAAAGPVRLALVELDEGPVVMGRAHDDALSPGDRAVVSFRPDGHDGVLVPSFAQAGSA